MIDHSSPKTCCSCTEFVKQLSNIIYSKMTLFTQSVAKRKGTTFLDYSEQMIMA